jgi:hypothetical protein
MNADAEERRSVPLDGRAEGVVFAAHQMKVEPQARQEPVRRLLGRRWFLVHVISSCALFLLFRDHAPLLVRLLRLTAFGGILQRTDMSVNTHARSEVDNAREQDCT